MSGFLQALPVTLEFEGGYTVDTGGPTYKGITQATYDDYRRELRLDARPVQHIEEDEIDHIYYSRYWVAAKCDALPWPLSLVHFDLAVNAGVSRAIKTLQFAVEAKPDGHWGPKTQERVGLASHDLHALMDALLWARLTFYDSLILMHPQKYGDYAVGWTRRVLRLRKKALEMW